MGLDKGIFHNLFIFEMANNHMGNVEHGLKIIREIHKICKGFDFNFGFKLQYRDLDTFIHPDFKKKFEFKYVKRFLETRLDENQFKVLKDEIDNLGFVSVCTPFDEASVDLIERQDFDIIKIGSCSATDWPLLERVVKTNKPIIVSTAGLPLEEIDKVVSFLEHREKAFALMHCVAEYPTPKKGLQLNQIDLLKARYPQVDIGYSAHEEPDNFVSIKIAIGKGARVFEKHAGIRTGQFGLNGYSVVPGQVRLWLESALEALQMCGTAMKRSGFTEKETKALQSLKRGVFASRKIKKGEMIELSNTFLAIPTAEGQITANDMSKYTDFYATSDMDVNKPIPLANLRQVDNRERVYSVVQKVKAILKKSNVLVPGKLDLEISHHYGVDKVEEQGCTMINFVNREYCKKLIVMLPGQKHPEQYHKIKEETFQVLYGDILLTIDGVETEYKAGSLVTVERKKKHSFGSRAGAIIEEISSTHHAKDSYYTDKEIAKNKHRKTLVTHWLD
ncbi:MAG: N-acetylneuraminate synthase family protein [Candidatus Gorgyraea atricola]|nr:N-acetylneuraminate synthase family protein [Candidatus Gorgyraea atricola]